MAQGCLRSPRVLAARAWPPIRPPVRRPSRLPAARGWHRSRRAARSACVPRPRRGAPAAPLRRHCRLHDASTDPFDQDPTSIIYRILVTRPLKPVSNFCWAHGNWKIRRSAAENTAAPLARISQSGEGTGGEAEKVVVRPIACSDRKDSADADGLQRHSAVFLKGLPAARLWPISRLCLDL